MLSTTHMKNVHRYDKERNKISILQQVVSLCEKGILNSCYALRGQAIFTQVIPSKGNDKLTYCTLNRLFITYNNNFTSKEKDIM